MPAYADGILFVGGGYGSHEFYAFDAATGAMKWKLECNDDGPTAAVVEDGLVAFNTESCTLIVCQAKTGKIVWQEWLGDPLMAQPAISHGKLYMAYPGAHPHGPQLGPATQPAADSGQNAAAAPVGPAKAPGYRLLCADLKTGKHLWEQDISADVISASVIDGDSVLLTCMDGATYSLAAKDGAIAWRKQTGGTSAPVIANGQIVNTQRRGDGANIREGIVRMDATRGEAKDRDLLASTPADYYRAGKSGSVALSPTSQAALDGSVGFAGGGVMAQGAASSNLNLKSVAGAWAYQGSRAVAANDKLMNAQSNVINCVDSKSGRILWQAAVTGKTVDAASQAFVPPAVGANDLYVCSAAGHFICVAQDTGAPQFAYKFPVNIPFQPCLAKGNMYAGTADGCLICLTTGSTDADSWYAWGGNAQHNKK
jgi:Ca-activated chloride channel family protein